MAEADTPKQIDDLALALLLSRLDTQDIKQDTTLREVRKTNGNVIDLKGRVSALEAVKPAERLAALEQVQVVAEDRTQQSAKRVEGHDRRFARIMQAGSFLTGAGLLEIGHALHWF